MPTSRVSANSILILTSEIIDRLLRFVLVILAARLLGDEGFGKFSFAIYFGSLFLIFSDWGLSQLLVREIARNPNKMRALVSNGLVLKLAFSVVTFVCIALAVQFTGKSELVVQTVYVMAGALILGSLGDFFSSVFQGCQKMKYEAIGSLIVSISNTTIGVWVLLSGGGILQLAWVYLVSRCLRVVYSFVLVRLKFTAFGLSYDKDLTRFFLKEGTGFGITRFFSMMYTYVDTTMLSLMIGDAVVGWYQAAYRLVFAMMVFPMGITRAVYPALSAYYKSDEAAFRQLFEKAFKIMFILGTSMATILFVFSDQIIMLLFGPEFMNASIALKILVWSTAIYSMGTIMTHTTRATGKQGFTAKVVAASAGLNLILNFILIPKYSFVGAAFATVLSEFFTFVFHFWFLSRYIIKPPFWSLLPKVAAINLGTLTLLWLLIDFKLLAAIAIALPAHLLLVVLTRFFSREELLSFKSMIRPSTR